MLTCSDQKEGDFFWHHTPDDASDSDEEPAVRPPQQLLTPRLEPRYYIQTGHPVRLRVTKLEWQDVRPVPPGAAKAAAEAMGRAYTAAQAEEGEKDAYEKAAFKVIVSAPCQTFVLVEMVNWAVNMGYRGWGNGVCWFQS